MKTTDEILEVAHNLSEKFAARAAEHDRDGSFPYENFDDIRASDYPLISVPTEYGGWGASLLDAVKAQEILAQGDGSTALSITMHVQVIGAEAASPSWRDNTFANLCREVVQRGALVNATFTEPELGSPLRGGLPKTTARHTPEGWIVNGRKTFATMSPTLDYFVTPAAVEGASDEMITLLIPRQNEIRIEETWDAMGMRSTGSHDIVFTNACVPDDLVIAQGPL
ncbi:MAG: acyl-CoA/acyl-ACP dehydrogenase, partial [Burkholderiales bacterium]|nr:acyl-CoA/acyl-ACP dehydrogenase [Anaerolineae bacterium]